MTETEWREDGVCCPDGAVWGIGFTPEQADEHVSVGDRCCGCGQQPHVAVHRLMSEWKRS